MFKGSCFMVVLFALISIRAFAAPPSSADKKEKPKEVTVSCDKAKDDNGNSYCDMDLTNSGNCGNALADSDVRNDINATVCCKGQEGDLTYMYSGTPYDPCSMLQVTGSGSTKKLVVKVNKDKDCNNQLCKEFPPTAMEGLDTAIGAVTCVQ